MTSPHWPLFGLRLRTPRLRLRVPTPADLDALADLAAEGVHDPDTQPFAIPWTDAPPAERARGLLQYHWSEWAAWRPSAWTLNLVVDLDGTIVGTQGLMGTDFSILREVSTGSWLGRRYQGQGIGTEMRAAVLGLAFDGLGAEHAVSAAFADNAASFAVSRKLGYREDGIERRVVRGRPMVVRRMRLDRAGRPAAPVTIEGLAPCLPLFGLPPAG
ncbi:GNAT family N-acetyltransferase [Actinoallomurus rhizosphaericola]|uniref:GNAT family N-acetyltransferase n=1 Tax=Actinoallomurus rhizosphaericola TaxID=2952536 RepID=UPI0020925BED|nr:GNAT family N-acetyltransferase [Actinoallomurus rhizosphaericola]MCO5997250.1 GNAT family N-acetyltransferase [Actinoallomurus rhizosphaericola]